MTQQDLIMIMRLTSDDHKRLIVNGDYICEFTDVPSDDWKVYSYFTEFCKDHNCNRRSCYANVCAYSYARFKKFSGKLYIDDDLDLGQHGLMTAALVLLDDDNKPFMSVNATDIKVEDEVVRVADFMKLIAYKPINMPQEPTERFGFSACQFEEAGGLSPSLEFGVDGSVFYEVIDMNAYKQGDFIPLDSPLRKEMMTRTRMTPQNINSIAERVNKSLDRVYNIRKEQYRYGSDRAREADR